MAKVKLIEVGGSTCGVCKMMQPMVDKVVSMFSSDELEYVYVYGDTDEGKAVMEEHLIGDVGKVPAFFIMKEGLMTPWELLEKFDGGITLPNLRDKIKSYI